MLKLTRDFLNRGPFRFEDIQVKYQENTPKTLRNYIYQGLEKGQLKTIKPGLYYVLPFGQTEDYVPDPFLIASKLSEDAVIAYHGALALHGATYSESKRIHFFTRKVTRKFEFKDYEFIPVQKKVDWGIETKTREGEVIQVTDRERTVLDNIDNVDYAGGFEELIKSIEVFPSVDLVKLESYLEKFGKQILYAKTGFILEQLKSHWNISEGLLKKLQKKVEGRSFYFEGKPIDGKLISRWNLVVPKKFELLLESA